MKMYEINQLPKSEIELRLEDAIEELYNLRFQHAMHQLDNPLRLRELRREIARLKTVLREFELGIRKEIKQEEETKSKSKSKK
ncbi:MAG: 50S ribosomal protein L29 [Calditrichaeota bacterium]|nr:MAG: 50S ribosomal protein L29 [Calditrichota bacterium]